MIDHHLVLEDFFTVKINSNFGFILHLRGFIVHQVSLFPIFYESYIKASAIVLRKGESLGAVIA